MSLLRLTTRFRLPISLANVTSSKCVLPITTSCRGVSTHLKDVLLYSTELDTKDSTMIRNPLDLVDQEMAKLQMEVAHLRNVVEADDRTNFSVALPHIYGSAAEVQVGAEVPEVDQVVEVSAAEEAAPENDTDNPVYPFAIHTQGAKRSFLQDPEKPMPEVHPEEVEVKPKGRLLKRKKLKKGPLGISTANSIDFDVMENDADVKEKMTKSLAHDELYRFGTSDPEIRASDVPCGGCGAILHCQDPKMPGFMPVEQFKGKSRRKLRESICQRCHVLKEYNIALKVNVPTEIYPEMLRGVHEQRALILLIVDLLDFPGSVWPGILDLLGPNKRIILVGNKVDMLPQDSTGYLKRVESSMRKVFLEKCNHGVIKYDDNIVSSILVSARTGYNIENLVTKILTSFSEKHRIVGADIYLVGTTNVGKSSIFNYLLESDLCKVKAIDSVEKAMTSQVPGTTLNLLKFPIMRPDPSRLNKRINRLRQAEKVYQLEEAERIEQLRLTRDRKYSILRGSVDLTYFPKIDKQMPLTAGIFELEPPREFSKVSNVPARLNPRNPNFADGRWCYDTPGTVSPEQIINLLTQDEISKMFPDLPLRARSFAIKNGISLFIAGLARFDLISGPFSRNPMVVTVFCSDFLPINMVRTKDADRFYEEHLGGDILKVPSGNKKRLADFPALKGEEFQIDGVSWRESTCELVLSSAGWISCTPNYTDVCTVKAWTPGGKGIYLRDPPFLPFACNLRGARIKGTPAYKNNKLFIPNEVVA